MGEVTEYNDSSKKWKIAGAFFFGVVLLANVFLLSKVRTMEDEAAAERNKLRSEIASLEESLATASGTQARQLREMRADFEESAKKTTSRVRSEAKRQSDRVAKLIGEKQREQQEMLLGQLSGIDGATKENRDSIDTVEESVEGVRSAVDENRTKLGETSAELAATSTELHGRLDGFGNRVDDHSSAIKRLEMQGQRDVTSFALTKSKTRKKVSDIQIRLRDTDAGKNRYTIEVLADDRISVHKDRYINQPVEFYVIGASQPHEIVVTGVKKDQIVGYLATPKTTQMARR